MRALRSLGRVIGINRIIARALRRGGYEDEYDRALSSRIRRGDCVWDVGANVGYYTRRFAIATGQGGIVYAFEPSPVNCARLVTECACDAIVRIVQVGLGSADGRASLLQGTDALGATSCVVSEDERGVAIDIRAGDSLVAAGEAEVPGVVKIDVEGHEWEVIEGLRDTLGQPALHTIGIEVHFGILEKRGMGNVPRKLEECLAGLGFSVDWPDSSHLLATRTW